MPDTDTSCGTPGMINRVSLDRPPLTKSNLVAVSGGTALVVWGVYPDGSALDRAAWALVQGSSTVMASGTFAAGVDPTSGQLFVLGSTYYLFSPSSGLYRFDGTSWTQLAGFTASRIVISGSHVFGVSTTSGVTHVVTYDGTTVGASMQVGSLPFVDAAGDGAGGVGIVMYDPAAMALHFVSGDGTTWSTESTVATGDFQQIHLAYSGAQWGVSALSSATPHTWLSGAGTWSAADSALTTMAAFIGNGGTFLLVGTDGQAAVYQAGAWTPLMLTMLGSADVQVAAFGSGYAVFDNGSIRLFDGTSWTPDMLTSVRFAEPLVVDGTRLAILGRAGEMMIYRDGTWSPSGTDGSDALAFMGTDILAASVRVSAGTAALVTNPESSSTVTTMLPQYATSGSVTGGVVTRGANGTALAIWSQYDTGLVRSFASRYTCAAGWSPGTIFPPPLLEDAYRVAALGDGFLVADALHHSIDEGDTGRFNHVLATGTSPMVASDGTTAVAVWQSGTTIAYATSTDGVTWTSALQVDTGSLVGLTGTHGSIIGWWLSGPDVTARVWHNGAWSAARTLASVYSTSCQASVGGPSAVLACTGTASGSPLHVERFDGTAWSTVSIGSGSFVLGTDGSDYRLEYALRSGSPRGTVLHGGSWSTPVVDPAANTALGVAGRAGTWEVISTAGTSYLLATANGTGALGTSTAVAPLGTANSFPDPFSRAPGHTDALLLEPHPLQYRGVSALYVAFDL